MRTFHIRVVNEHFSSTNEHKCEDVPAAWKEAISGALAIAAEQVSHGNPSSALRWCWTRARRESAAT